MRFYRVSLNDDADGHAGYQWFTSRREAVTAAWRWREDNKPVEKNHEGNLFVETAKAEVEEIHIVPTRTGIRQALNMYASHNNNG